MAKKDFNQVLIDKMQQAFDNFEIQLKSLIQLANETAQEKLAELDTTNVQEQLKKIKNIT